MTREKKTIFSISLGELQHILFSHTYLFTFLSVMYKAMKCPNKCGPWEGRKARTMEEIGEGVECKEGEMKKKALWI